MEIIKEYILAMLKVQEIRLKAINLGATQSKDIVSELKLIKKAEELVNNKL